MNFGLMKLGVNAHAVELRVRVRVRRHAHTVAHALVAALAVVAREIALLVRVYDVEQTCGVSE